MPKINIIQLGTQGVDISIVTNANSDEAARKLLGQVGMPFAKN